MTTKNSKIETGYLDSQDIIENQLSQYLHAYQYLAILQKSPFQNCPICKIIVIF